MSFQFLSGIGLIGGVGAGGGAVFSGTTAQATESAQMHLAQTLALTGGDPSGLEIFGSPAFLEATGQTLADLTAQAISAIEARTEAMFFGLPPPTLPAEFSIEPTTPISVTPGFLPGTEEPPDGGASVFTREDLNPFLDVLIHATQPRSQQPKPGRTQVLTAATLAIILEILRRLNMKRAQDRNKRAAESILAQQQAMLDRYLKGLRDLFGARAPQQGGEPVAFDVGGFLEGAGRAGRDILTTPGNLQAILGAFGVGGQQTSMPAWPPDLRIPTQQLQRQFVQTRPVSNPLEELAQAFGFNGDEGLNGGGFYERSPVTGKLRPKNKLAQMRGTSVDFWLRAVPSSWKIIGAGSGSVSKYRRHHHHRGHHPH